MRLLTIAVLLLALLALIPIAAAQDMTRGEGDSIEITEPRSLQEIIDEYGCPVGIRDANQHLRRTEENLIAAGQRVLIPRNSPLCDIAYDGEIEFYVSAANNYGYPLTYWELAAYFNVCEEMFRELNPEWTEYTYSSASARIPVDSPECFETVELAAGQTPHDLALEYNVCENVIWYYNNEQIYEESSESRSVYLPLDRQPCYINGQVLVTDYYPYQSEPYYVPAEIVQTTEPMYLRDFAIAENYCLSDIEAANRGKIIRRYEYETVYVPEAARHCIYLETPEKSIVEISQEYNVCLEALMEVNTWANTWSYIGLDAAVFIPTDAPPCYDENGLRISHNDRLIHETSKDEWLFGIAQQYGVCVSELFETNPLLANYPREDLPSIIFIPDSPCSDVQADGFIHHVVREPELVNNNTDVYWVSYIYNVCPIEIILANPQIVSRRPENEREAGRYILRDLEVGETLLIPTGRPCYDFHIPMAGVGHYQNLSRNMTITISYVCYASEIDPLADYTGYEPAISPVPESPDAYCYDRLANPYIVLNNVNYTLYPMYGDALLFDVAECFGVNTHDIVAISDADLGIINTDYPTDVPRYWGVQNPTLDCPLVGTDSDAALAWLRTQRQQSAMGTLNENGEYSVTYGDTLSSIGRRYGYLPEWIMAENNLSDDMIFVRQTLRLPSYPNLYQLGTYGGAIAGGILLFLGASFALKLRSNRRKGKKKNDE